MQKALIRPIMTILLATALLFGLAMISSSIHEVGAQAADQACEGVGLTGGSCDTGTQDTLGVVVTTVVNILSIVVGAVSVIMIIVGGLRYVTSGGDAQKTAGAKNTILYALVGLVIVIFAQIIVSFVINETTGDGEEQNEGQNQSLLLNSLQG